MGWDGKAWHDMTSSLKLAAYRKSMGWDGVAQYHGMGCDGMAWHSMTSTLKLPDLKVIPMNKGMA